jgi:NADH-quinone oxidoreductase subunit F
MLGSAGVIVLDETVCIVKAALNMMRFYQHESCGQCTPCRQGTYWLLRILHRIEHGEGTLEDLEHYLSPGGCRDSQRSIHVATFQR